MDNENNNPNNMSNQMMDQPLNQDQQAQNPNIQESSNMNQQGQFNPENPYSNAQSAINNQPNPGMEQNPNMQGSSNMGKQGQFNQPNPNMNAQQPMGNQPQFQGMPNQGQQPMTGQMPQQNMYQGNQQGISQNPNMQGSQNPGQQGQFNQPNPNMNAQQPMGNQAQFQGMPNQGQQPMPGQAAQNMFQGQQNPGMMNNQGQFQGMQNPNFNPAMQQPKKSLKEIFLEIKDSKYAWAYALGVVVIILGGIGYGFHTRYSRAINNHKFEMVDTSEVKYLDEFKDSNGEFNLEFTGGRVSMDVRLDGKHKKETIGTYKISGDDMKIGKDEFVLTKSGDIYKATAKNGAYIKFRRN